MRPAKLINVTRHFKNGWADVGDPGRCYNHFEELINHQLAIFEKPTFPYLESWL
jgi:hypothetical protein